MASTYLLDVDGVLLDFNSVSIPAINKLHNLNLPLDYEPIDWGYSEVSPNRKWWKHVPNDWPANQTALPLAREFVVFLKTYLNARIVIVTSLNPKKLTDRMKCLRNNGIEYDEIYAVPYGVKKSQFISEITKRGTTPHPCIFIDDKAENAYDVLQNNEVSRVYTLNKKFNQETFRKNMHLERQPFVFGSLEEVYVSSICHQTGWSAEFVSNKLKSISKGVKPSGDRNEVTNSLRPPL